MAAVLNPEGKGEAHLQVNPVLRNYELEIEMLETGEQHLFISISNHQLLLCVRANAKDVMRKDILTQRNYHKSDAPEYLRRRPLSRTISDVPLPAGYKVRVLGEVNEVPLRSWVSWKAFHPDEPDRDYRGWEWYLNVQHAPLYRHDLDLVIVTPDGEFASFCTVWFDDINLTGAFESVGTRLPATRSGESSHVRRNSSPKKARSENRPRRFVFVGRKRFVRLIGIHPI